jgi:hypothetical protein
MADNLRSNDRRANVPIDERRDNPGAGVTNTVPTNETERREDARPTPEERDRQSQPPNRAPDAPRRTTL